MTREVKLSRVGTVLDELDYPTDRAHAAEAFSDVTLLLADGERDLGAVIEQTPAEECASADEFGSEINDALPREAVGEPYQSEGEG